MPAVSSNIEITARAICIRLYSRHWPPGPDLDAEIDRHWHVVAALLEAGLMDESGVELASFDMDQQNAAVRDWRTRHRNYAVPPPVNSNVKTPR